MKIAVVGNGPSAQDRGAEIDAHDFVVRCNWFAMQGGANSGTRLDAWAWYGQDVHPLNTGGAPAGAYECWFGTFVSRHWMTNPDLLAGLLSFIEQANGRTVRFISREHWAGMFAALNCKPSTGFVSVALALEKKPEVLSLYGFDATTPDRPGWQDAGKDRPGCSPWPPESPHNFCGEKQILAVLAEKGLWLGTPCPTKLNWPARPAQP